MGNILVTGGAGYVGSICAAYLLETGHNVIVVDDLSTGHRQAVPHAATFHRLDIGDERALSEVLRAHPIDVVFHFAAKALIAESVTNPAVFYRTNVHASFSMLETLRAAGIRKFVFSSTAAVYGNPNTVPIVEDHPKNPVNSYGESKLAFENLLRWYVTGYGWSVTAFRYFNACGATENQGELHQPETHIIPLLLQAAAGDRSHFEVYGTDYDTPDGSCLRDYVHVLDIAEAHTLALTQLNEPGFHVYNIGTGRSYSVLEVCHAVEEVTGLKAPLRYGKRRPGDPAILCASPENIKKELGWTARRSDITEIIRSAWEWHKSSSKRYAVSR
jgi:UDP-glucose 4-epimerase